MSVIFTVPLPAPNYETVVRQLIGGENQKLTIARRNASHYVIFKSETLMCNGQLIPIKCKFKKGLISFK